MPELVKEKLNSLYKAYDAKIDALTKDYKAKVRAIIKEAEQHKIKRIRDSLNS